MSNTTKKSNWQTAHTALAAGLPQCIRGDQVVAHGLRGLVGGAAVKLGPDAIENDNSLLGHSGDQRTRVKSDRPRFNPVNKSFWPFPVWMERRKKDSAWMVDQFRPNLMPVFWAQVPTHHVALRPVRFVWLVVYPVMTLFVPAALIAPFGIVKWDDICGWLFRNDSGSWFGIVLIRALGHPGASIIKADTLKPLAFITGTCKGGAASNKVSLGHDNIAHARLNFRLFQLDTNTSHAISMGCNPSGWIDAAAYLDVPVTKKANIKRFHLRPRLVGGARANGQAALFPVVLFGLLDANEPVKTSRLRLQQAISQAFDLELTGIGRELAPSADAALMTAQRDTGLHLRGVVLDYVRGLHGR